MSITKIEKYIKQNKTNKQTNKLNSNTMTGLKTDVNLTKNEKYKKPNMTEHKTDMNITKIDKYRKN